MSELLLRTQAWFGDETLAIDFPPSWKVVEAGPPDSPAMTAHPMKDILSRPIGARRLSEIAKDKTKAIIVVDDLSRPTPAADLLPLLVQELLRGGLSEGAITVMLAGGTHPPASVEDMAKKVGSALSPAIKVMAHDSRGDLVDLGVSPAGLPLKVNRSVMECDLKIGVGCIYPHPIAGFSGGAKIVLPAICGVETTRMMHDYLGGSRERGGSIHTELRRDMIAVARKVGLDFIANVTLNHRREISALFAGDVVQAHEAGVRVAERLYAVSLLPEADVVVADMYPFDTSWQFAQDRGMWPIERAKQNASRVVIASCPLGLGTHELFPVASPLWSRIARRVAHFRLAYLNRHRLSRIGTAIDSAQKGRTCILVNNASPQQPMAPANHDTWRSTIRMQTYPARRKNTIGISPKTCRPMMRGCISQLAGKKSTSRRVPRATL